VCSFHAFSAGGPNKDVHTHLWGLGSSVHRQGCGCCPAMLPTSSST
jgi:hypothetical protein